MRPIAFVLLVVFAASPFLFADSSRPEASPAPRGPAGDWLLLHARQVPRPIVLPAGLHAGPALDAARLLQQSLRQIGAQPVALFPIRAAATGAAIRLELRPGGDPVFAQRVGYAIDARGARIWAQRVQDLPGAASWFLERELGARWFMPGPLGEDLPARRVVRLAFGSHETTPAFLSRSFASADSPAFRTWALNNRLVRTLVQGHTAAELVQHADLARDLRLAPLVNGRRYLPADPRDAYWQPDLTADVTLDLVVSRLRQKLSDPASPPMVAFGQNDSWRWDQSAATLRAVTPERHFRGYPVYSDLLFAFMNRVATKLAPEFPDRLFSTYAYQWTEQTPRFAVHPQVVPVLTADRSQWFDPAARAEDQELIRRWVAAGPRLVATYDYYYGSPFVVPRPTLYAVRESVPFLHAAGVRAFYAEAYPNWGLDGPKLWLAAQLLWDADRDADTLLADYYTRYWAEAAAPMRRYFELCDQQYLQQPRPGYWIKYFKDDHQTQLFPPDVRRALNDCLAQAARLARTPAVRARVAFTQAAFEVADLFCRHEEARDALARLAHNARTPEAALVDALERYSAARTALVVGHQRLRRERPLALGGDLTGDYLRHDPRSRALRRLAAASRSAPSHALAAPVFAGLPPTPAEWIAPGQELLRDTALATVQEKSVHPFTALDWNVPGGPWFGKGEPFETRRISLSSQTDGPRSLRFSGVSQEGFAQTVAVVPGALYRATVRVRGHVSPGNMTFLLLAFTDSSGRFTDLGHIDRLPLGSWPEWTTLEFTVRAPRNAQRAMLSLRALFQVGDDFAEFASPSLRLQTP
jgi:hypothetical protein